MKTVVALRLEKDHELSASILPEVYFKCSSIKELGFPWPTNNFERQNTEIRVAWSAKFLYVHYWAHDNAILATETKPKGKVYLDDCLEFFARPDPHGPYVGWEINALGTLLEYTVQGWGEGPVETPHFDYKWKSAAQWKTQKHNAGWVLELKIPFEKDFGKTPARGDRWAVTFNRIDVDTRGRLSSSTWSTLEPEPVWFHQPRGFGELVFG